VPQPSKISDLGTAAFKEGFAGYRRGPVCSRQEGWQQELFQQRYSHPQHPHSSKQIKQGPGSKIKKRLICHKKGGRATVTRRPSCCHKEAAHCHKEAALQSQGGRRPYRAIRHFFEEEGMNE